MNKGNLRSIGAVLAGFFVIAVLAVVTDSALQWAGILPVTGEKKFEDRHSLLALAYHLLYSLLGCYLAARLAPTRPMAHALVLGGIGFLMSILGLIAIIAGDLAPAWYGWLLAAFAFPVAWAGGTLFLMTQQRTVRTAPPGTT